jgi:hypothetical protein
VGYGVNQKVVRIVLLAGLGTCASCTQEPSATTRDDSSAVSQPKATIQDLMKAQIEPSAVFIWEAVSTTTTAEGTEERQPQTPEEWLALRHQAITLVESANLLLVRDRKVAADGGTLEDANVEGISTPDEIQRAIDSDRQTFAEHAHELHDTATQVLAAIDAKDPVALLGAGGHLDEACESCHATYWYPNTKVPPELAGLEAIKGDVIAASDKLGSSR